MIDNLSENSCVKKPMYGDVVEKTIVEICTSEEFSGKEEKYIHFMAFGYKSDAYGAPLDHRFLEYTFFFAPLRDVLKIGVDEYESEYSDDVKQYIEDCTSETMVERYLHYNNGECPSLLPKNRLDLNTPDGFYILI